MKLIFPIEKTKQNKKTTTTKKTNKQINKKTTTKKHSTTTEYNRKVYFQCPIQNKKWSIWNNMIDWYWWLLILFSDTGPSFVKQKTSYHKKSWSLEAARYGMKMSDSSANWTGVLAAMLPRRLSDFYAHYSDVIMSMMATHVTDRLFTQLFVPAQMKENIEAPRHWPFVRGIHRWPVNSPHKGLVTRKRLFIWWWCHHDSTISTSNLAASGLREIWW